MTRNRFLQLLGDWTRGEGPLYLRLSEALRNAIERGELSAGTKMPAQRVLARWLDVSRTTVVMAYDALVSGGGLESRRGSGTTVRHAPERLTARGGAAAVLSARNVVFRGLVERSGADVEFLGAHLEGLPEIFEDTWQRAHKDLARLIRGHGYMPLGLPDLRAAIARHLERSGLPTKPEEVLVTNGAQQAITLLANLLVEPGDAVALEDPTYPGAIDAFTAFGARLIGVPHGPKGFDVDALRRSVKQVTPRLVYLIPTCHNPTGDIVPEPARLEIMRVLEGSGAVVIEDMTLADLAFEPMAPAPLGALGARTTVVTIGSLSKLFWGGLRVGWIRGPEPLIARLARLKVVSDLSASVLSQTLAMHVLGRAKEIVKLRRKQVRTRYEHIARLLGEHLPEWTWRTPEGGLSLWIRLPHGDASQLAMVALRHGVAIVPGTVSSCEERWSDHLRLPFVAPPAPTEAGIKRIAGAWAEYTTDRGAHPRGVGVVV